MTEFINELLPIVAYDPAIHRDKSIITVSEKQTVTVSRDFENPVTFPRYRVLHSVDLKGMDYTIQAVKLAELVTRVRNIYGQDPAVCFDATGNEGLVSLLRQTVPHITPCKFAGNMNKEYHHEGRFRILNKAAYVGKLGLLLEGGQILIDSGMPAAKEFRRELEQFSASVRVTGSVAYEAGTGHDDMISCLLLTISKTRGYWIPKVTADQIWHR